jgi:hypothetical protein
VYAHEEDDIDDEDDDEDEYRHELCRLSPGADHDIGLRAHPSAF